MSNTDVLIVDDHTAVRQTLRAWLSAALPECAVFEAADGEEALGFVRTHSPCVVLMDLNLGGASGLDATRSIKALSPTTQVVIVSLTETDNHRDAATAAGAVGYVAKERMGFELLPILERLLPARARRRSPLA